MSPQVQGTRRVVQGRRWPMVAAAAALLVAGGGTAWSLAPGEASVPAADATPQQVVQAYAQALHVRDCTTARELAPTDGQAWCGADITPVRIVRTTHQPDGAIQVWVRMTVHGGDRTMPDGQHDWSFVLNRTGPRGAWRITTQGMG